ncbi:MAG: nuclear transport factor 2 family protein [Myxococcota bacterium]
MSEPETLQRRIEHLEARLAEVEAVQAIHNLKSRYGQLLDSRYGEEGVVAPEELERIADAVTALFSEDATWDGGAGLGVCRGSEAIRKRFLEPALKFSWHYFVKPRIEVMGDRATGTWDILAPCTSRRGRAMWMSGYEDDEYVKQDGVWLHQSMKLSLIFMAPHDQGWASETPSRESPD